MVVVMKERATEAQIDAVIARLIELGMDVHRSSGATRTVLGVVGAHKVEPELIGILDGVHEVLRITEPYKRASRTFKPDDTVVSVGDVRIGGDEVIVMAGPCSAETDEQVEATAAAVKRAGAKILRGGAFKPRSSPYSFQGSARGPADAARARPTRTTCKLISEVMDVSQIELVGQLRDIFQVGARNMQNYTLLRELGHARKPVLLKRGISATIEEWLLSAEYILAGGNNDVILCERGIRTFETATRNTFDISAIPVVKKLSHLPIVADPSHGAGRRDMVAPMARAAVAAGADGLIIEVHNDPDHALSDGAQSMFPAQFDRLMAELRIIAPAIGRSICLEPAPRRGWVTIGARTWIRSRRFDRVAIAGVGLIGGSIALGVRERWPSVRVYGVDAPAVLAHAHRQRRHRSGAGQRGRSAGGRPGGAGGAGAAERAAADRTAGRICATRRVVTDVGGTKRDIVKAAAGAGRAEALRRRPPDRRRRAGRLRVRPAGSLQGPALDPDARMPTTPTPSSGCRAFAAGLGARPMMMDADEHDRVMAFVSHLPQLAASALMEVVGARGAAEGLRVAGRGLVDTTRLASSPASVWRDICVTNADAIRTGAGPADRPAGRSARRASTAAR